MSTRRLEKVWADVGRVIADVHEVDPVDVWTWLEELDPWRRLALLVALAAAHDPDESLSTLQARVDAVTAAPGPRPVRTGARVVDGPRPPAPEPGHVCQPGKWPEGVSVLPHGTGAEPVWCCSWQCAAAVCAQGAAA